jgi:hypothetical protein
MNPLVVLLKAFSGNGDDRKLQGLVRIFQGLQDSAPGAVDGRNGNRRFLNSVSRISTYNYIAKNVLY